MLNFQYLETLQDFLSFSDSWSANSKMFSHWKSCAENWNCRDKALKTQRFQLTAFILNFRSVESHLRGRRISTVWRGNQCAALASAPQTRQTVYGNRCAALASAPQTRQTVYGNQCAALASAPQTRQTVYGNGNGNSFRYMANRH